tara:strand:+ start:192 stop:461 length:270 start_codon:yes stop_codon:yes gene_type:complete
MAGTFPVRWGLFQALSDDECEVSLVESRIVRDRGPENIAPSRVCHDDRSEEAGEEDRVRDDGKRSRFESHRKRKKRKLQKRSCCAGSFF